jgi:uncharacterized protein HemX
MAVQQRNPNDPYRDDLADDNLRRSARLEQDQQLDPQLSESKMSGGKIAAFAVAIALAFGAIFYGMNATSNNPTTASQTTPATQNSAQNAPAVRDVTPSNSQPGMTTGAAPSRPQPAPATPGNGAPAR